LYLIDTLGIGGAERGLVLTLQHLDRSRFESEVAILRSEDTLVADIEALGIPVHRVGARSGPFALLSIPRVVRLVRTRRYDVVHTQILWASIIGRIAGRIARVRVISHVTSVDPGRVEFRELSHRIRWKVFLLAKLDEFTGRFFVDRFIAISQAVRNHPIRGRSWDRRRISVVERGLDLEWLLSAAAEEPSPPLPSPRGPRVLNVARHVPAKGHRYLLRAFPDVVREFPDAELLLAGEGTLGPELRDTARFQTGQVRFLGLRRDVPALLARVDVFVFPSLWEGVGTALREAMMLGLPIVASDIPAIREYVRNGETGLLVPPADPGSLAAALIRLLRDREAARAMGGLAAQSASRFDIRRTTRDLEAVYLNVLGHCGEHDRFGPFPG
jgi:glycosyltransferase involved in cell wall biosynthesis